MKILVTFLLFLTACTAEDHLEELKKDAINCRKFKQEYEEVNVSLTTSSIRSKIKYCQELGVWE